MRIAGVDPDEVFERRPLELVYPDGTGLRLPPGRPIAAFARGVFTAAGWHWSDRIDLSRAVLSWGLMGFRCDPALTVAQLAREIPPRVREELIEPLCVAALNTPAERASASVFLRVLRDALFSGPGSADLLLPRRSLSELLPAPAARWLIQSGAGVRTGRRVATVRPDGARWLVDGEPFDAVIVACSAPEAVRLTRDAAPAWAARTAGFEYEPIITVYLRSRGSRLAQPMMALRSDAAGPAQFVFDHGALGGAAGLFAAVVSGARTWVERGAEAAAEAVRKQLTSAFPTNTWKEPLERLRIITEKRATFCCTPTLARPAAAIAPSLWAAGDYVEGPYPSTLEGAVRSGIAAVRHQHSGMQI
jgi:hypothetical protein